MTAKVSEGGSDPKDDIKQQLIKTTLAFELL